MDTLAFLNLIFLTCFALILSIFLFKNYLNARLLFLIPLCIAAHFLASYLYFNGVMHGMPADSTVYFYGAQPSFGFNTQFAQFISWYMRDFFWGDSLLSAFFFSSLFGYFGDVLYVLSLFEIFNRLDLKINSRLMLAPLFILLFWPTHIYFTVAIVKDSGAYFCIALFTYALVSMRSYPLFKISLVLIAAILAFIIRPYLLIDFFLGACLLFFFSRKIQFSKKLILLIGLMLIMYFFIDFLLKMGGVSQASFADIGGRFVKNQVLQESGTSIPVPTTNPYFTLLFLPYLFLANLFLPLFIFAKNMVGILASFENAVFIWLCYYAIKHRQYWKILNQKIPVMSLLLYFAISGIGFLSLMNTNLGLATREKTMFVPIMLLLICCVITLRRADLSKKIS